MAVELADRYDEFLAIKRRAAPTAGKLVDRDELHPALFDFQKDLVRWALLKGRSAIFADTGLGKTPMQLEWGYRAAERTLILAPLGVTRQTVAMAADWGIEVTYARRQADAPEKGITVTNYEMLDRFDLSSFGAVVLDESSILKSFDGKTRGKLIETCRDVPMRLCCTATPAPNDISELANHAEFLGIMARNEMLAMFFVHDDEGWRLKGHAREPFYQWLASWGMSLKRPSDLGYPDDGFILPDLDIRLTLVPTEYTPAGQLFATALRGVRDRAAVRQQTLSLRVQEAAEIINREPDEQWVVWCGLNEEGRQLARLIPGAILVEGADKPEYKADALMGFADGRHRVLVSKVRIAGFGMNFQGAARMAFVGLSDSWEQYYQAIRRCWRFGQQRPVVAHVILTEPEEPIYANILRKERESETTAAALVRHMAEYERAEIGGHQERREYMTGDYQGEGWRLLLGDSCQRLAEIESQGVDLSVFSPPFSSLYTYSPTERDLGNSRGGEEFWEHFGFVSRELFRVTKPGRHVCVHVAQVPTQKARDGVIGLSDFRGDTIRHFVEAGFVYHGEVCIDKDPQAQAIRTHSKALAFMQLHKDSSWLRPALADYIVVFRVPGENQVAISPSLTNDEWIEWARPVWYGIRETDTLNAKLATTNDDERHICPLQLGTIERVIRLWSNRGELVLSPFAGIGSEGYQALLLGRRFIGIELKPEYARVAARNLAEAERQAHAPTLFDGLFEQEAVS